MSDPLQGIAVKNSDSYQFWYYPKSYGSWVLGGKHGLSIASPTNPNWFHIKMMKLLLGIDWVKAVDDSKPK